MRRSVVFVVVLRVERRVRRFRSEVYGSRVMAACRRLYLDFGCRRRRNGIVLVVVSNYLPWVYENNGVTVFAISELDLFVFFTTSGENMVTLRASVYMELCGLCWRRWTVPREQDLGVLFSFKPYEQRLKHSGLIKGDSKCQFVWSSSKDTNAALICLSSLQIKSCGQGFAWSEWRFKHIFRVYWNIVALKIGSHKWPESKMEMSKGCGGMKVQRFSWPRFHLGKLEQLFLPSALNPLSGYQDQKGIDPTFSFSDSFCPYKRRLDGVLIFLFT
nr:hypothetical protein Iba_chr09eCG9060 [Ipomoea batatas]